MKRGTKMLTALVLERRLKVLEKGCRLGKGHGPKVHDAQAYARLRVHLESLLLVVGFTHVFTHLSHGMQMNSHTSSQVHMHKLTYQRRLIC